MKQRILGRMAVGALLLGCAAMAQAQWMWVNERGVKQFSDRPPPTDVPQSRILKAPVGQGMTSAATPAPPGNGEGRGEPAPSSPNASSEAPKTLTERNADFNKRRVEASEKEQKVAQEEKDKARKTEHCRSLKSSLAAMESGVPTYKRDEGGGRTYYTEAEQANRIKESRNEVASNCR